VSVPNKDVLEAVSAMESRLLSKMEALALEVSVVKGNLDTHTRVQEERSSNAKSRQDALEGTVYGDGNDPGLKLKHNTLATQIKVVAGILVMVATATFASVGGWVLYLVQSYDNLPKK
jgi:hypothetical protein